MNAELTPEQIEELHNVLQMAWCEYTRNSRYAQRADSLIQLTQLRDMALAHLRSQPAGYVSVPSGFYVASRASIPARAAMWRRFRESGVPIVSSWIDEAGEGETADFAELWDRIEREISGSRGLVLYVEQGDFPLKGALVEVGMALAMGKRVAVVTNAALYGRTFRPLGSWLAHRNCIRAKTVNEAFELLAASPPAGEGDKR